MHNTPRIELVPDLGVGPPEDRAANLLLEADNLPGLAALPELRGAVDLVLTDPPYNTGREFRYRDRVRDGVADDRHGPWLRFLTPRLTLLRDLLRPGGVLAVCIDHRELFRLGLLLDDLFGEDNRLGIINWQKSYSPRNDSDHLSAATEYVLVYAKDAGQARTLPLPRTAEQDRRYRSPDGDPRPWKAGDMSAADEKQHRGMVYAVQSPFTGLLHYPPPGRHWGRHKDVVRGYLEAWGSPYLERRLPGDREAALVIANAPLPGEIDFAPEQPVLARALAAARRVLAGVWPVGYWAAGGRGTFSRKYYLDEVRRGRVPITFWAGEEYDPPLALGDASWPFEQSGHSETAMDTLTAILGPGHRFETAKPVKLFKKIVQLWCPPGGLVLDPFAGSGTTGHAVLELNGEVPGSRRRFVLIEQGRPDRGDAYARELTAARLRRVATGEWARGTVTPLGGGFRFGRLVEG